MMKYKIIKLQGASPEVVETALNKRAEEGFTLEFMHNGWFILSKYDYDEDYGDADTVKNKDENEEYPWELDMAHPDWKPRPVWDGKKWSN